MEVSVVIPNYNGIAFLDSASATMAAPVTATAAAVPRIRNSVFMPGPP